MFIVLSKKDVFGTIKCRVAVWICTVQLWHQPKVDRTVEKIMAKIVYDFLSKKYGNQYSHTHHPKWGAPLYINCASSRLFCFLINKMANQLPNRGELFFVWWFSFRTPKSARYGVVWRLIRSRSHAVCDAFDDCNVLTFDLTNRSVHSTTHRTALFARPGVMI